MENIRIIVASDSVGETAELVARACISQFNPNQCDSEISRYPYIEALENVDEVISVAKDTEAIVVYTLVKPEIRKYMEAKISEFDIKSVDIMGPLMNILLDKIDEQPYFEPGLVHQLDEAYFKRLMQLNLQLNMMMVKIRKVYQKQILSYWGFQELQNPIISIPCT